MTLTEKQLRFLRGRAHALKPFIMIGQSGLTENVVRETRRALADHELIKVRIRNADRAARESMLADLVGQSECTLVTRIGHVAVLYRPREGQPGLILPDP